MNTVKKAWVTPRAEIKEFTPNEYVSACYSLSCSAASGYPDGVQFPTHNGKTL